MIGLACGIPWLSVTLRVVYIVEREVLGTPTQGYTIVNTICIMSSDMKISKIPL